MHLVGLSLPKSPWHVTYHWTAFHRIRSIIHIHGRRIGVYDTLYGYLAKIFVLPVLDTDSSRDTHATTSMLEVTSPTLG